MAETSIEAYEYLKTNNLLTQRQQEVLNALKELGTATSKNIAKKLHKPLHTISGRITELKDMGIIEVIGKVKEVLPSFSLLRVKSKGMQ